MDWQQQLFPATMCGGKRKAETLELTLPAALIAERARSGEVRATGLSCDKKMCFDYLLVNICANLHLALGGDPGLAQSWQSFLHGKHLCAARWLDQSLF